MDIKQSPSGKILKTIRGYYAFVPNELPPQIEWDTPLINSLSKADHLLGKLSREGASLANPHLFVKPFIAREAVLSSKIEGTQTTLGELLAKEAGARVDYDESDSKEVQNYIDALNFGIKRLQEIPVSLRLIKEIHEKLMQGVRGSHATPGEFRHTQNWIGSPGSTIATARYVPPPQEDLMECLAHFELFLYDRTLPSLIQIGLCHYQFEAIHPFLDGNGRVGRLLIILLLIERNMLSSLVLYLSAFFEATRDEYYSQLYKVSSNGTWNEWLMYFLNGIALQSEDALSRTERINLLISQWHEQVNTKLEKTIVKHLAANPYITSTRAAETFNVAFTTIQRAINRLEKLGIITQTSPGLRNRVYCALQILVILEEPAKINHQE